MKKQLIIVGKSANARQAYDFIKIHDLFDILGFTVNREYMDADSFNGLPVFALEDLREKFDMTGVELFVALGWNRLNADRRNLYERLKEQGYKFANLISPNAVIRGKVEGDNCWVNDYAVIQSGAVIKSNVIIREHVLIGNDALIEKHCFIGVHSIVAGGCHIGEQSFCGIRATVFDGVKTGNKCIIGGGAVLKRNIESNTVCKTDLSSTVLKVYDENEIESKLMFNKNVR
ncbi:MAG: hypothetical protein J1F64_02895 [Oscillospiraceae bacterium]|nr:hypothetical protein [Oscillospiraceae bacterium]